MSKRRDACARRTGRFLALSGLALAAMVASAGCRASTQGVTTYGGSLPRPQLIVVHDFTSLPGSVSLGSGVTGRLKEEVREMEGTPLTEQQAQLRQKVAAILTSHLVQEIRKLELPVEAAATAPAAQGSTLSIEGQFLTIDEGNRARRLVIGLGAGASEVRTAVQVFETAGGQHRLVEDFYVTAHSSRKPGFGPMAGVGAATGAAVAVTTAVGVGTEVLLGPQDAENDSKQAAVAITRELAKFFARQGWITPEQAERYHRPMP